MDNSKKLVTLGDKRFELFIPAAEIDAAIGAVAMRVNRDYADRPGALFLVVLNGAFMFAADLMKKIDFPCEVSFVKYGSYSGTASSGEVSELIGISGDISGRDVVVVEDIVDTGRSMEHFMQALAGHRVASVEVATLLFKPEAYKAQIPVKYIGLSIPDDFVVGFGLDYDQMGRNLPDIYKIADGKQ